MNRNGEMGELTQVSSVAELLNLFGVELLAVRNAKSVVVGDFLFINPIGDFVFVVVFDVAKEDLTRAVNSRPPPFLAALVQVRVSNRRGRQTLKD